MFSFMKTTYTCRRYLQVLEIATAVATQSKYRGYQFPAEMQVMWVQFPRRDMFCNVSKYNNVFGKTLFN